MTDPADPKASAPSSEVAKPTGAAKEKKARSWKRRIGWTLGILLGVVIVARIALVFALPPVLRSVFDKYGLVCTYERAELYLTSSDVGLWHVKLAPKEGGPEIARAEYVRANISTSRLLLGKLLVHRIDADAFDLTVDRDEKGRIPLLDRFIAGTAASSAPAHPAAVEKASHELSLASPVRIDALRIQRVRTHFRDRSVTPNVDTQFELNVRVTDLASDIRPARFLIDMTSPPLLDSLRIEGQGTSHAKNLDAEMSVILRGFHPKPAAGYLAAYGIKPASEDISAQLKATIRAQVVSSTSSASQPSSGGPPAPAVVKGTIGVSGAVVRADLTDSLALDRLVVFADGVDTTSANVVKIGIDGVRASAVRDAGGELCVAGLAFAPIETKTASPEVAANRSPAPAQQSPSLPAYKWKVDKIELLRLQSALKDEFINPPAELALNIPKLTVTNLVNDPAQSDAIATIDGELSAPGISKTIRITGTAKAFGPQKSLDLALNAEGIRPDALRGYLEDAGVESKLSNGSFAMKLKAKADTSSPGSTQANLAIEQIRFGDGKELLAMNDIRVSGLKIDGPGNSVRIDKIELAGPDLSARRSASGVLEILGLKTRAKPKPASDSVAVGVSTTQPSAPVAAAAFPRLEIGQFIWKDIKLRLDDEQVQPPSSIALNDAGIELNDVKIDLDSMKAGSPGKIRAWLNAPDLAKKLEVSGTVTPGNRAIALDVDVVGEGLNASLLAPYLKGTGIEPVLKDGALKLHATASVAKDNDGDVTGSLGVENLTYADAGTELVGLDALAIDRVVIKGSAVELGAIDIQKPRAAVTREKNGALVLAGVRITPPATQPAQTATTLPPATAPATEPAVGAPSLSIALSKLSLKDGAIRINDHAVSPEANLEATASATVENLVLSKDSTQPAKLNASAKIAGAVDAATIVGTFVPNPSAFAATLDITATGIKQGPLAPYLPPGTQITMTDGRFRAAINAEVAQLAQGGQSAKLVVSDLDYRDGADGPIFLHLPNLTLKVSRFDPDALIAIDELSATGLETEVRKTSGGEISAMGLTIGPAPAPPQATAEIGGDAPASQPAELASTNSQPADVKKLIEQARKPLPLVTLDKLDLNVKRASVIDSSKLDAPPIMLSDLRLRNTSRFELLGKDPKSNPPISIELRSKIEPLVDTLLLTAVAAPFSDQGLYSAKLDITGIKGDGLTLLLPDLRKQIDGSGMTDGRFTASVSGETHFARRGSYQFDFTKPIDASFVLKDVAFRAAPDGPVLAGVQEVRADTIHLDPSTGAIRIKQLDVSTPAGFVLRDQAGVHALGFVIRMPKPGEPATQPAVAEAAPPDAAQATEATAAATPAKPKAEMRLGRLIVSGVDFRVEDRTTEPPTIIPLNSLDVEVRDLSNMALYEERPPVRFSVLVGAGKVPIQPRSARDASEAPTTLERELFSQITAVGKLSLYPQFMGWAKASVSGMELAGLRGAAKSAGVELDAGVFDSTVDARLPGDGTVATRSRFIFSDLRLKEPPNGPIQRFLKLPAPLDTVIVALEDVDGGITIPLPVELKQGEFDKAQVSSAVVGALGSIITTALASAPLKMGAGVAGLIGFGDKSTGDQIEPIVLGFSPAATALDPEDAKTLGDVVAEMRGNKKLNVTIRGELSDGDVARAAVLANPSAEDCLGLASQLRQQKMDLLSARSQLAGQARGQLAVRSDKETRPTIEQLRELDRQIASTEDALDRVYEMLKPGAERQADRRTRAAAIEIGQARLDAVHAALLANDIPNAAERVKAARAQFSPSDNADGGRVLLQLTRKK